MCNFKKILICLISGRTTTLGNNLDPNCRWISLIHSTSTSYPFPANKVIASLLGFLSLHILFPVFFPTSGYEFRTLCSAMSCFLIEITSISVLKLLILCTLILLIPLHPCYLKFSYSDTILAEAYNGLSSRYFNLMYVKF